MKTDSLRLPQTVTRLTSRSGTPAFSAITATARIRSTRFSANQCSRGTSMACCIATRQLVLQGSATTRILAQGQASLMARACSTNSGVFERIASARLSRVANFICLLPSRITQSAPWKARVGVVSMVTPASSG